MALHEAGARHLARRALIAVAAFTLFISLVSPAGPVGIPQALAEGTTATVTATAATSTASPDGEKLVLFINSYDPGFDTVPIVANQVSKVLRGTATIHYLYMNEKYESDAFASAQLTTQLDSLMSTYRYDAVILGDDAAFDYAVNNRDRYFANMPLIYEGVNSVEKASLYNDDPLITGVVEAFPMRETIEVAKRLMPDATRVVVIGDGSVSAAGSVAQAMAEQSDFPDLSFETFDCSMRTPEQIQSDIASYGDDAILLYTVFNTDGDGNRYGVTQGVRLITDVARVPVFKADTVGVGDGLVGGYVLSYESIGMQTGEMVLSVLGGDSTTTAQSYITGSCEYLFDAAVLDRYNISTTQLPAGSKLINNPPTFFDTYGVTLIWILAAVGIMLLGYIAYSRTKQRRLQAELAERDIELKAEEAANQAKTEFLSRMSHDVRTPLNAMLGMNELALEDADDEKAVREYLGKSRASGELLLSLISNVLDVSRIESGRMQLEPMPCRLSSFADGLRATFEPSCELKHITLEVAQDAGDAVVLVDRVRLNQILCNLLSNAVKFTPAGGTVSFELTSHEAAGDTTDDGVLSCNFVVADDGPGISEEFQERMFQPFTQDLTRNVSESPGSGLGLMIVRSITELMGGTVKVTSAPNQGTSFLVHLDLPRTSQQVDLDGHDPRIGMLPGSPSEPGSSEDPAKTARSGLEGLSVLVVEDNALNSEIMATMLGRQGMVVTLAQNGKVAVDQVAEAADGTFDVILMDNRMPVMSGLEATRNIRALGREWTSRVPIIAVTADVFKDDLTSLEAAGIDAWVTKPVDMDKLCDTIVRLVEKDRWGGTARQTHKRPRLTMLAKFK